MSDSDGSTAPEDYPRARISRLEAKIDALADGIDRCRKIVIASKIAIALGAIVLVLLLVGAVRYDPVVMMAAVIAFLGGIVMFGTNTSTAKQMAAEIAQAETVRAELIDGLALRRADGGLPYRPL